MTEPRVDSVPASGDTALVTGASGFIGSHLALRLVAQGLRVRGLVRSAAKGAWLAAQGVEIVEGDLADADSLRRAARGCSLVFSVAGWVGQPGSWDAARRINLDGTRALVEAAVEAGARRIVHTSSIAAYGPCAEGVIDETWPLRASDAYGATKAAGESIVLGYADRIETSVIRPAQVYGPRSGLWTLGLFTLIRRGVPILIGGGRGTFHPSYIDNLIDAYMLAAVRPDAVGQAFTIVDGVTTWREFTAHYARMAGRPARSIPVWPVRMVLYAWSIVAAIARLPTSVSRDSLDFVLGSCRYTTDTARQRLGWSPRISIDEGMRAVEAWLRAAGHLG